MTALARNGGSFVAFIIASEIDVAIGLLSNVSKILASLNDLDIKADILNFAFPSEGGI